MENNAPTNTTKSEFNKNNLSVPSARSTASRHGLMKITRKRLFSETLITYLEKKNKKKKHVGTCDSSVYVYKTVYFGSVIMGG